MGHRKLKGVEQETKVSCIVSNELPSHHSTFNRFIYGFGWVLIFLGSMEIITAIFNTINYFYESTNILSKEFRNNFVYYFLGILQILVGYNNLSYLRGVSNKAQRNFIILGFFLILIFILDFSAGFAHGVTG